METQEQERLKIEDVLRERGAYIGPTVGVSMLPMLKSRRDTIVVRPKTERLQRLDVALYKRGDAYVLHRVLAQEEGGYLIRGDNCYSDEHIPEEDVFGVLTEFFRKGKHIFCTDKKYLAYAERRVKTYKIRKAFMPVKWKIKGLGRRLKRIFVRKKKSER